MPEDTVRSTIFDLATITDWVKITDWDNDQKFRSLDRVIKDEGITASEIIEAFVHGVEPDVYVAVRHLKLEHHMVIDKCQHINRTYLRLCVRYDLDHLQALDGMEMIDTVHPFKTTTKRDLYTYTVQRGGHQVAIDICNFFLDYVQVIRSSCNNLHQLEGEVYALLGRIVEELGDDVTAELAKCTFVEVAQERGWPVKTELLSQDQINDLLTTSPSS